MFRLEKILLLFGVVFGLGYLFAKGRLPFQKKKAYLSDQDELDISRMVHEGGNPEPQRSSVQH